MLCEPSLQVVLVLEYLCIVMNKLTRITKQAYLLTFTSARSLLTIVLA